MNQANPFAPVTRPAPPPAITPVDVSEALQTDPPPGLDGVLEALLKGGATVADEPEVVLEPRRPGGPGRMPGSPNKRKILKYSHKALADAMILNPNLTGKELASLFGRTPQWVYLVQGSDAFQSYLAQRQAEILDPSLRATLQERARALTLRSMEVMHDKLQRPIEAIPDQFALRAFELASKASALGGNAPPPPAEPGSHLPELARRLDALMRSAPQQIVDVASKDVVALPQE